MVAVAALGTSLAVGTAVASADDRNDRRPALTAPRAGGPPFDLEIDPELDARFGPRRVNAVQAAGIVAAAFPGARVTEAELDERNGGPIWEITFDLGGGEREVDVDANTGAILRTGGRDDGERSGSDDD
jgi:Peptidase propeptide and YPEB domain